MKKMILLSFLGLLTLALVYGQNKDETPTWNTGDKWILGGIVTIMVVNADESSYAVEYSTPGEGDGKRSRFQQEI